MTEKTVRLTNGQQWTARDFLDHYFQPTASGTTPVTGPPQPVDVDRSWYMSEGPGRYYHPGMFPIMRQFIGDRSRPPGTTVAAASSPAAPDSGTAGSSRNDIAAWIASLAGVSPQNPTQSEPPPLDRQLHDFYRDDPAWLLQIRR